MVRVEVVLEDVGAGENGVRAQIVQKYSTTHSRIKL